MAVCRALAAALTAALMAPVGVVVIAAAPADAASAFTVKGTQTTHPAPYPEQLVPSLFAGDTVTRIDYPAKVFGMDRSIAVAVAAIDEAIQDTPGAVVVAGFSQGAIAVTRAKLALMAEPDEQRPAPDELSFVTVGDPYGPGGFLRNVRFRIPLIGLSPTAVPDTPYDTVIVDGEYDGWADFPDRPWNLISLANALLGVIYVHGRYELLPDGLDLTAVPERNITATTNSLGGRTTTYLVPTEKLPLVAPLRDIGVPEPLVAALEKPLRSIVDAGYARNDPAAAEVPPPAGQRPDRRPERAAAAPRRSSAQRPIETRAATMPARGAAQRRAAAVM